MLLVQMIQTFLFVRLMSIIHGKRRNINANFPVQWEAMGKRILDITG